MTYKNLILTSLKESLKLIWKNKLWFMLLFVLEILFFAALSIASYNYQIKIVEHSNSIFDYISKLKLDDAAVADNFLQQKSVLGNDPLLISREFNEILKNFRLLLLSIFISLVVFLSFAWTITIKIIHKLNVKNLAKHYLGILAVLLFYLGLIFIFFYFLLNLSLSNIVLQTSMLITKYILFFIVVVVLLYFMFISLSIVQKTGFKNIVQKTLIIGIKKIHYVLGIYAINLILSALSVVLFFKFFEESVFVLFFSIILLMFTLIFGRFLMINAFEKLD